MCRMGSELLLQYTLWGKKCSRPFVNLMKQRRFICEVVSYPLRKNISKYQE